MLKNFETLLNDRSKDLFLSDKKYKIVSIATTANINNPEVYIASNRESKNSITLTILLKEKKYIKKIIEFFDSKVDFFLLDTESKSKINNFLGECEKYIKHTKVLYYKPNDLTVDCVKNFFLKNRVHNKNILICGLGNIGTKLALALSEISNNVFLCSSDKSKLNKISTAINLISKSDNQVKSINYKIQYDYILGTSSGVPCIQTKHIDLLNDSATVIDVGNGSIDQKAIKSAIKKKYSLQCVNVINEFIKYIEQLIEEENKEEIPNKVIKKDNVFIKAGLIGDKNDIIVDNPIHPTKVYGICNGKGDLLYGENIEKKIKKLKKAIENGK